jgi:hypothetical protein
MDKIGKENKTPTKERIGDALERLRNVRRISGNLMEKLMNGDVPQPTPDQGQITPPVVFMSLWESLPDTLNEISESLEGVLTELETRLLN